MHKNFFKIISTALNLSKTDTEIIKSLICEDKGLLINELVYKIKRSERNIRYRLDNLLFKGLLKRKIEVLNNGRLAYRYYIESRNKFFKEAKKILFEHIKELNSLQLDLDLDK